MSEKKEVLRKEFDKSKYVLGLDLGVTSVGWALLDPANNQPIDQGVYLFDQANKAEDRRAARSTRRRYNRTRYRKLRLKKLLADNGIDLSSKPNNELLELRNKGLEDKLSEQEIVDILYFFVKNRGYIPFEEGKDGVEKHKIANREENKNKYPCQIQKIILEEEGKYRSTENKFLWGDYKKEIRAILENQYKQGHKFLTEDFINKYFEIYESKRKFWEGPGSYKNVHSLSPYGRYRTKEDIEEYKKDNNYRKFLFEELLGECKIYTGEKVAPKNNVYAEYFNLLNDLFNLRVEEDRINEDAKHYFTKGTLNMEGVDLIVDSILSSGSTNYSSIFKKNFGLDLEKDVSGYKKDADGKPEIAKLETFASFIRMKNVKAKKTGEIIAEVSEETLNKFKELILENPEYYNDLVNILEIYPKGDECLDAIVNLDGFKDMFGDESYDLAKIIDGKYKKNKYHSLSEKALLTYIKLMQEECKNSSWVSKKCDKVIKPTYHKDLIDNYPKNGKVSTHLIKGLIANPQVKKSLSKAIYIINTLMEKYPNKIGTIAIESNKESMSPQDQKDWHNYCLEGNKQRQLAKKKLKDDYGIENPTRNDINRYLLLEECDFKCAFCNKPISLDSFQIEHILPLSKSADDSFNNKTCSCNDCNNKKNNRTPLEWLSQPEEFIKRVKANKKFSQEKKNNLLFSGDLSKYEKKFINRNLRDTAYVTSELKKQLMLFAEANNLEIGVMSVPPVFTSQVRTQFSINKNRDENVYHHAQDAMIVAMFPLTVVGRLSYKIQNNADMFWSTPYIDNFTNKDGRGFSVKLDGKLIKHVKDSNYDNTRIKKDNSIRKNASLSNANLNTYIEKDGKYNQIRFINNIYECENKNIEDILIKKPQDLLMYKQDKETIDYLISIYEEYKDKKIVYTDKDGKEATKAINPFKHYCLEKHSIEEKDFKPNMHGIRMQRKGNKQQPVIVKLKYVVKDVSTPWIINKCDDIKQNKHVGYDSVKQKYIEVYKGKDVKGKEKYFFLPISFNMFKTNKEGKQVLDRESSYYKAMFDTYIIGKNADVSSLVKQFDLSSNDIIKCETKDGVLFGLVNYFHKSKNGIILKDLHNKGLNKYFTQNSKNAIKIGYGKLGKYGLNFINI